MTRFHINPQTGNPNQCKATQGNCPFGGTNDHYNTKVEARDAYESHMDTLTETLQKVQKEIAEKREDTVVHKIYENNGLHMNPFATNYGDEFVDEEGARWRAGFVNKPSLYGVAESAGPSIKLTKVNDDGELTQYSKDVQFGGYYNPDQFKEIKKDLDILNQELAVLENSPGRHQYGFPEDEMTRYYVEKNIQAKKIEIEAYKEANKEKDPSVLAAATLDNQALNQAAQEAQALEDFYSEPSIARHPPKLRPFSDGEEHYSHAVVAEIQYNKKNPGTPPTTAADTGTKVIIVPGVQKLTNKRRLEIGEELWRVSGRSMERWTKASDEEKLHFTQMRLGRYKDVEVKVTDGEVDFTLDDGRRQSYGRNGDDVTRMHIGPTS